MINNHVVNVHVTATGLNRCHHAELEDEERAAPWLEPDSPAHRALADIVCNPHVLGLAEHVVNFRYQRAEIYCLNGICDTETT